ncbi:hypothetical protein ACJK3C_07200 [Enterococcus faecium]
MKRLGLFWLILLLVIVAFYMEPVLFPPKLEVKENSDQQISNQMTTWKYGSLSIRTDELCKIKSESE